MIARIILGPKSHRNSHFADQSLLGWLQYPEVSRALAKADVILSPSGDSLSQSQPCADAGTHIPRSPHSIISLAQDVIALAEHCGELADLSDGPCTAEVLCGEYACEQVGCIKLKADSARAVILDAETAGPESLSVPQEDQALLSPSGRWRKRPVVIDAIQWTGSNLFEVATFIEGSAPDIKHPMAAQHWDAYLDEVAAHGLRIYTLEDGRRGEAKHVASQGDWIIKGVQGEFYPCKPDIFAATYEPAEAETVSPLIGGGVGEKGSSVAESARTGPVARPETGSEEVGKGEP